MSIRILSLLPDWLFREIDLNFLEMRLPKEELERRIFELIKEFNEENDAKVESVTINYDSMMPNARFLLGVKVEIKS